MKNSNGQGSISYEADRKQYRAAFVDPTGKRIRKRFPTKTEAEEWLTLKRAEILTNSYIPKAEYTLGEWIVEYLTEYVKPRVKPTTIINYKKKAKYLNPLNNVMLDELNNIQLQKFFNSEFEGKPSTAQAVYDLLNAALRKAVALGVIRRNVVQDINKPKVKRKVKDIFTPEEINTILNFCKGDAYYKKYYPLILLAATTGMRLGEILGLKFSCVFKDHIIIENNLTMAGTHKVEYSPKTEGSEREITISANVYDALQTLKGDNEYVFISRAGTTLFLNGFDDTWKRILERAGVRHRTFHTLRHTHASILLSNGVPITEVSKRLGHNNVTTTLSKYSHFIKGYDKTLPDKIDNMYDLGATRGQRPTVTFSNNVQQQAENKNNINNLFL